MNTARGRTVEGGGSNVRLVGAVGGLAVVLTAVGLSGVGDAPAPFAEATAMAEHFREVRTEVLIGAALSSVGVAAIAAFGVALASRLAQTGERAAALAVGVGLIGVAGYLLTIQVIYTTLSYGIAATSAEVTKGMFVATILAVPVFGLGAAALLFGAAVGCWRAGIMPVWWRAATLTAATSSSVAVFSYADEGFFSPDVQQQVVAYVVLVWLSTTSVLAAIRPRHLRHDPGPHDQPDKTHP